MDQLQTRLAFHIRYIIFPHCFENNILYFPKGKLSWVWRFINHWLLAGGVLVTASCEQSETAVELIYLYTTTNNV